jgi:hypothetical protein
MINRKKTLACMRNEVREYILGGCSVGITDASDL